MRLSVFGLGQVGQVLCACFAEQGHSVTGVDVDSAKVADFSRGVTQLYEPKLAGMLARHVASGLVAATSDAAAAIHSTDISFVCVGTPSDADGRVDTTHLAALFKSLRPALDAKPAGPRGHILVIRSTCPWPTLQRLLAEELPGASTSDGPVGLAVQPEFLREGSAVDDFFHPSRTLIGTSDAGVAEKLTCLYRDLPAEIYVTSPACALMVKYADNAFHAMKVAFANEIGRLCHGAGIDALEVMRLFRADAKLNCSPAYLRPGTPFGGSCLPKDLRALTRSAREADAAVPLLSAVLPSNRAHLSHVLRLIERSKPTAIGLFGISFKPGTKDLRESPSAALLTALIDAGYTVRVFDPHFDPNAGPAQRGAAEQIVPELAGRWCESLEQLLDQAQLIVVAASGFDWRLAAGRLSTDQRVLDLDGVGRQFMDNDGRYEGVC